MAHQHDASRTTYDRFLEFERLMKGYPGGGQPMNPTPIGFCAFALTLFVYSFYICGATVPMGTSPASAMGLALFYGGLIQLIAGLLEYRLGNNFHALIFCSYAGYWLGLGSLYVSGSFGFSATVVASADMSVLYKTLGVFYLGWLIFTLCMLLAAIRTHLALVLFFFFLMLTYIFLTSGYFLMNDYNTLRAGGAFGIVTSLIGWFIGFASLLRKGDNSYFNLPNYSLAPKTGGAESSVAAVPVERRASRPKV